MATTDIALPSVQNVHRFSSTVDNITVNGWAVASLTNEHAEQADRAGAESCRSGRPQYALVEPVAAQKQDWHRRVNEPARLPTFGRGHLTPLIFACSSQIS